MNEKTDHGMDANDKFLFGSEAVAAIRKMPNVEKMSIAEMEEEIEHLEATINIEHDNTEICRLSLLHTWVEKRWDEAKVDLSE